MIDQAQKLRQMVTRNIKKSKIITVSSGKGGVGKSNFVVNLSIVLQKMGKKVLIFDADVGMGNDDVLMGFLPKYNIFDIIYNNKTIDEVLIEGPYGVKLLPGGTGLSKEMIITDEQKNRFIDELISLEDIDYIFIDTGAGINRTVLGFIACCDELILIMTPDPTSLTDCYSLIKAVNYFKLKNIAKVVINRVYDDKEGKITYSRFRNAALKFLNMDIEYLGKIAEDKRLVQSVRVQKPFVLNYPECLSSRDIFNIAQRITGDVQAQNKQGIQGFFKKLFGIFS